MPSKKTTPTPWWVKPLVTVLGAGSLGTIVVTSIENFKEKGGGGGQVVTVETVGRDVNQAGQNLTIINGADPFKNEQPRLSRPYDGLISDEFPRKLALTWEPVAGATSYEVEIQWQNPDSKEWHTWVDYPMEVKGTSHEMIFPGTQPGRWRVLAMKADRTRSQWSDWRKFTFVQKATDR
ncbi:MAG: hypothetical protein JNJ83_22935 [Verrucomicrobiaceae bacterium]|nr:hypothetical protein [Verrucomicrobiaceae bacterium]